MVKSKEFIYVKLFDGPINIENFRIVESELSPLKDGEFLAEAVYLSVDPYMREYVAYQDIGQPYIGGQVAKIVESKNARYPVGRYVVGNFGWRSHTVWDPENVDPTINLPTYLLPDFGDMCPSVALGVLGMSGNTAYFGLLEVLKPQWGETLVVSGAEGAVGSLVGQIGKILGLNVIGIAGSNEKGRWLTEELNFDYFINYKTANICEELKIYAPEDVDCYFDNVGGDVSSCVYQNMKTQGRVAVCGVISSYNGNENQANADLNVILFKQLKVEGFIVTRWNDNWFEGIEHNFKWITERKLKYKETIMKGFQNMPLALITMMNGDSMGKMIVEV